MTNDVPDVQERGPGLHPAPPPGGPPLSDVWVYNGRAYDLSDWISKHPGGAFFIGRTKNRDITAIIASYHRDPAKVERILERRYALGRDATPRDIHPKHNAPPFLFKEDFNSWRDTPKYRFDNPNDLMHRVKARLAEPVLAARIKRMDRLFNIVVALLAAGYLAVQAVRLAEPRWMPLWAFVIAMVLLRSSLVGYGHYALHRAQRGPNRFLANAFDLNYVALSLVVADGHTLLHHPYTQSDVDIKKNVFTMMMQLPRLYRVPVHTVHKFGHLLTGMAIRIADVWNMTRKVGVEEGYGSWRNALPHFLGSSGCGCSWSPRWWFSYSPVTSGPGHCNSSSPCGSAPSWWWRATSSRTTSTTLPRPVKTGAWIRWCMPTTWWWSGIATSTASCRRA
ncbi:hypothetical protein NIIDMKKI_43540 [Mycobacterium kansasii]|uniref:Cytochrome b5 heme-binding domain-containing protein n=1 Tax=Mycobacterium kansasii TaxID=1768 RepID=A0A7G1IKG1_MYCKA|nr:hypothetical protein NIIDMKKI_43540 [Mycobacterium kansasii]